MKEPNYIKNALANYLCWQSRNPFKIFSKVMVMFKDKMYLVQGKN